MATYLTEGSFANSLYVNYVKPAQEKGVTVDSYVHRLSEEQQQEMWSSSKPAHHIVMLSVTERRMKAAIMPRPFSKAGCRFGCNAVVDMTTLTKNLYDAAGRR